jgi:tetratricopeptide (TPR) repeat protein
MCYGLTNDLNKAIISFQDALKFNIQLNDSSGIGLSYYNIGLANHFMGHYEKAIENYIKSADIRGQIGETKSLVSSLISIGEVFRLRKDYNNAQVYYDEAITHKAKLDNKETLAYLYSELALIHKATKRYETSLAYIDTAMNYSQEINYKRGIATLLCYKAGIYKEQGELNQSLKIYDETIERYKDIGFETGIIQSNIAKAEILTEKEQYNQALNILLVSRPMAINNELLDEQTEISEIKYKLHKELNQSDLALAELELFLVLSDSLFGIEKEEKIKEIEAKYETKQKEQQIELLDKENKISTQKIKSRNLILTLLFVFVLLLILVFFLLQKKRKAISELEIEKNRHRLLQAQMNPHFIYNSLSAIQSFILKNNPMDSVTYISEFSSLTRLVLEGARCDLITLKDDVKLVNAYLKLQQMRFGDKFNFTIEVNNDINTEVVKLPPMLSQPYIENAVEHGMRNKKDGKGKIIVDYSINEQNLIVSISDNGEGFQESEKMRVRKHKSLATKITNERIENIRKALNLTIHFQMNSDNSGTKIIFTIPQKK